MADLYECEIVSLIREEGPAFGVAILAGVGTGVFSDVREISKKLVQTGSTVLPIQEEVKIYKKYHNLYDDLYEHMKDDFNALYDL